jgi:hypothetical protein
MMKRPTVITPVNPRREAAALVLAAVALGGCGTSDSRATQVEQEIGNPAYVFDQVEALRDSGLINAIQPRVIAEALPNYTVKARTVDGVTIEHHYSNLVAVGRVTDVQPGDGIVYPSDPRDPSVNDEESRVVKFDDPSAAERNVTVTMKLESSSGERIDSDDLTFRMGVVADADPAEFLAGLRGLKEIAVVLTRIEDGRSKGDLVPVMGGALLGEVDGDTVSFPALGTEQAAFMGAVNTVDELMRAADAPPTSGTIDQQPE